MVMNLGVNHVVIRFPHWQSDSPIKSLIKVCHVETCVVILDTDPSIWDPLIINLILFHDVFDGLFDAFIQICLVDLRIHCSNDRLVEGVVGPLIDDHHLGLDVRVSGSWWQPVETVIKLIFMLVGYLLEQTLNETIVWVTVRCHGLHMIENLRELTR